MSEFESYFDESGTHDDSPVTVVAGGLAERHTWETLILQWDLALKCFGVNVFHASDLNNKRGEYDAWTEDQCTTFTEKLLSIIDEANPFLIGAILKNTTLRKIERERNGIKMSPYQICSVACVKFVAALAQVNKFRPVTVCFEARQKSQSPLIREFVELIANEDNKERYRIDSVSWVTKGSSIPLEVSDFIAYEIFQYHRKGGRAFGGPFRKTGLKLFTLFESDNRLAGVLTPKLVNKILDQNENMQSVRA